MSKTIRELYGGKVKLTFQEFQHQYKLEDGTLVPSVTTILSVLNKPALINWAANQAVDYVAAGLKPGVSYDEVQLQQLFNAARKAHAIRKQDTADIGSMVHDWIERYINGEKPEMPINEQLKKSVENFLDWQKKNKVEFLLSEQPVFSKEHKYCGTLDFVAKIEGELFLGDIKTSSAIYDEYFLQLAAYGVARSEEFPEEKYKSQGIIRISRDGSFQFKLSQNSEDSFQAFLAAKRIFDWQAKMKFMRQTGQLD